MTTLQQMLGLRSNHIDFNALEVPVHNDAVSNLYQLKQDANKAGFDLAFASGFRSFDRQKNIWNAKALGTRQLLDAQSNVIDIGDLTCAQIVMCILHWSALPGGSRHHWGSEVDIYDKQALGEHSLQLSEAETASGGIFEHMYVWLEEYLKSRPDLRRPYHGQLGGAGGVANEPWHISVVNVAKPYETLCTRAALLEHIQSDVTIALNQNIIEQFDDIYSRFVSPYFMSRNL